MFLFNYFILIISLIICILIIINIYINIKYKLFTISLALIVNSLFIVTFFTFYIAFLFYFYSGSIEEVIHFLGRQGSSNGYMKQLAYILTVFFEELTKLAMVFASIKYAKQQRVNLTLCYFCGIIFGATEAMFNTGLTYSYGSSSADSWLFNLPMQLCGPLAVIVFHGHVSSTYALPMWNRIQTKARYIAILTFATVLHLIYNSISYKFLVGLDINDSIKTMVTLISINFVVFSIFLYVRYSIKRSLP